MATYVDDVALDAEARRRKSTWTIISLLFTHGGAEKAGAPFLSLHPEILQHSMGIFEVGLSQAQYVRSLVRNWE